MAVPVAEVVAEHYKTPGADVLLLSELGDRLIELGAWPAADEKRPLHDVVKASKGVVMVRKENSPSFIPIVLEGDEARAMAAIADHEKRRLLSGLARPVLFAFTREIPLGDKMFLEFGTKTTFHVGEEPPPEAKVVDEEFRSPGLAVSDLGQVPVAELEKLELNIRAWCERHSVAFTDLMKPRRSPARAPLAAAVATAARPGSALERLYAAQPVDIASRLSIPMDIALTLSRLP